ncbi:MAG TPA: glycosyltransferase family 39 protein [Salinivirgaceae bacterium]|nr:glycosyltransferase family 39 protein [Salinivirgaceae bacterium]
MKNNTFRIYFWIIIVIAALFRFYNYTNIPYTHDEYSAIHRTNFETFSELIENGVLVEGHPAGVQVFLYYYTKVFGKSPHIVRLPFTILGLLSIALIMIIGKRLFSYQAGLFAGACAAVSQYFIFYSLVARPYSPGLFFVLLSVYCLVNLTKNSDIKIRWLIIYSISLALSAYTHQLSAFTSFIIFLLGFFLVYRKQRVKYLASGVLALLLYTPHIPIFFKQLSMKGVGDWLPVPDYSFIFEYIGFLFHYSWLYMIVFFFMIVTTTIVLCKEKPQLKNYFLLLIWLIVYITTFVYSRKVSSVMQHSALLFVTALLVIFISMGINLIKNLKVQLTIIIATLFLGSISLIHNRQYYDLVTNGLFQKSKDCQCELYQKSENERILFVSNHPYIPNDLRVDTCSDKMLYITPYNLAELNDNLKNGNFNSVGYMQNSTFPAALAMIKSYYPAHIIANKYDRGEFHYFSLSGDNKIVEWDTIAYKSYDYEGNDEFLNIVNIKLDTLNLNSWSEIDIVFRLTVDSLWDNVMLVTDLNYNDKTIDWRATNIKACTSENEGVISLFHTVPFPDIKVNFKEHSLKSYIYNPELKHFKAIEAFVMIRESNRLRYALIGDIPTK